MSEEKVEEKKELNPAVQPQQNADFQGEEVIPPQPDNRLEADRFWLTCPKCRNFPIIETKITEDKFLLILKCTCSKEEAIYSVDDYMKAVNDKKYIKNPCDFNPNHHIYYAVNYCFDCDKFLCGICLGVHKTLHPEHNVSDESTRSDKVCDRHLVDNEIVSFCLDCRKNMCKECLRVHDKYHEIYNIRQLFSKEVCEKTFEEFKEAMDFMDTLERTKKMFDKIVHERYSKVDPKILEEVNKAYVTNKKINSDIIKFISLLYENYKNTIDQIPNMNLLLNLKNNSSFKSKEFKYEDHLNINENLEKFLDFCRNSYIFKTKDTPIELVEDVHFRGIVKASEVMEPYGETKIILGDWSSVVNIVDLKNRANMQQFFGHFEGVCALCVLPNGWFISGSQDAAMNIYDPNMKMEYFYGMPEFNDTTINFKGYLDGHSERISKIIKLKSGNILTASYDKKINLYDNKLVLIPQVKQEEIKEQPKDPKEIKDAKDSKEIKEPPKEEPKEEVKEEAVEEFIEIKENVNGFDMNTLANATEEEKKKFLSKRYTIKLLHSFTENTGKVFDIFELKNGKILSCSEDKTLRIFDVEQKKELKKFEIDAIPVKAIEMTNDLIAVACIKENEENVLRIYGIGANYEKFEMIKEFAEHSKRINSLIRLENGNLLTVSSDGSVVVYNTIKLEVICKRSFRKRDNLTCALQMGDRRIAVCGMNDEIKILY